MTALVLVHGLHVLAGVVWAGGLVAFDLGVWPVLLALPAPEARRLLRALGGPVGRLMRISGMSVFLLGLLRAVAVGPIRSLEVGFGTAYGRTCLVALAVTVALSIRGARAERFHASLFDGDRYAPGAAARVVRRTAVDLLLVATVLGSMVALRFGL